jgi:glyoxylase-like metal-dependent hydrolase (beta-lactamase superfamily II)
MRQDFHAASSFSQPVTVDVAVEDHDELALGDSSWEVIHTPGHDRGHICLYHRPSGHLLSGDHLLPDISSNPVLETPRPGETERPRSLVQYLHSLKRVAALEVAVALPGHGAPIKDLCGLVAERVAFHRRRAQEMMTLLVQGPRTAYQITKLLFTDLHGMNLFLGLSEVIGHLDILEDEGRVVAQEGKMPVLYALAEN